MVLVLFSSLPEIDSHRSQSLSFQSAVIYTSVPTTTYRNRMCRFKEEGTYNIHPTSFSSVNATLSTRLSPLMRRRFHRITWLLYDRSIHRITIVIIIDSIRRIIRSVTFISSSFIIAIISVRSNCSCRWRRNSLLLLLALVFVVLH